MLLKSVAIPAALFMSASLSPAQAPAPADTAESPNARVEYNGVRQDGVREDGVTQGGVTQEEVRPDNSSHPELSANDGWARDVVLVILFGFFVPAAIIGPWVRKRVAADMPELHDQEEQSALTASQHEPGHTRPPD